jgi:diguanylate cyclase (GGDEF)-like protein
MRVANRHDFFLIVGMLAAVLVVFSGRVGALLDFAYAVDRSRQVQLLPALVVVTFVVVFYLVRKRNEVGGKAKAAVARVAELERLVGFGEALARSLDLETLQKVAGETVPQLVPGHDVWVASPQLGLNEPDDAELAQRFPMEVAGEPVGVIGIRPSAVPLSEHQRAALVTAAALLGVSIKNAELFRQVLEMSVRDPMTGCFRRYYAIELIETELQRARRTARPLSIVMFDLDHFKSINDQFGHPCGDAVLSAVGRRMTTVLRGSDIKCRYGGEEFLLLLPDTPTAGAMRVAESLRVALEESPVLWDGKSIPVTASFGVTTAVPGVDTPLAIITRADAALYRAKQAGRNCVRPSEEPILA